MTETVRFDSYIAPKPREQSPITVIFEGISGLTLQADVQDSGLLREVVLDSPLSVRRE